VGLASLASAPGLVSPENMADHRMQRLVWRVLVERPFGEQQKKGLLAGGKGKTGNKEGQDVQSQVLIHPAAWLGKADKNKLVRATWKFPLPCRSAPKRNRSQERRQSGGVALEFVLVLALCKWL